MTFDGGWEVTHAEGRTYVLSNRLEYDAKTVKIVALTRTTGKPDARPGVTEELRVAEHHVVGAGTGLVIDLAPTWPDAPLPFRLQIDWYGEFGQWFRAMPEVPSPSRSGPKPRPDLRPPFPPGFATRASQLAATRAAKPAKGVTGHEYAGPVTTPNPSDVWVVHGRNMAARDAMFTFLRALQLRPIEWNTALGKTGSGSPYVGQVLDEAFAMAQAVVVLLTPDDIAHLRREYASGDSDPDLEPKGQARPNVLFEAGMAFGRHPDRTILVELGEDLRQFSDVVGRHAVRLDDSFEKRNDLAQRLKGAGCAVDTSGSDWTKAGDFTPPKAPSGPMGRRLPSSSSATRRHLDGKYLHRGSGSDRIQIINIGGEDVFDLTSPNSGTFHGHLDDVEIPRLPAGKSASLIAQQAMGAPDAWDLIVKGHTGSGDEFTESLFLDLNG